MQLYKQQSSTPFPFPAPPPPISKFRYCCEVHYTYLGFGLVVETTRYENNSLIYNSFKCVQKDGIPEPLFQISSPLAYGACSLKSGALAQLRCPEKWRVGATKMSGKVACLRN